MSENSDKSSDGVWVRIERDLNHLRDGLGLLGIKPCAWCGRFFRTADAGVLFDGGETACFGCIPEWWPHRRGTLSVKDREMVEQKLVRWLMEHHHARVISQSGKPPEDQLLAFHTVVA